jgi:hypothetical protein
VLHIKKDNMKKNKIVLAICMLFFIVIKAQTYTSFAKDSTYWVYHRISSESSCPGYTNVYNYKIERDTTIGGNSYQIISKRNAYSLSCSLFDFSDINTFAYIRNDSINRKVYCRIPSEGIINDTLLYNFDLQIGDTIKNCLIARPLADNPLIVTGKDSVFFDGSYKKGFVMQAITIHKMYEMIGLTTADLFGAVDADVLNSHFEIKCFVHGDSSVADYPIASTEACNYILASIKKVLPSDFNLYPSPCYSQLTIEEIGEGKTQIYVSNLIGELVFSKECTETSTKIDVNHLPSGMYILQVQSKNGVVSKKFVKE